MKVHALLAPDSSHNELIREKFDIHSLLFRLSLSLCVKIKLLGVLNIYSFRFLYDNQHQKNRNKTNKINDDDDEDTRCAFD